MVLSLEQLVGLGLINFVHFGAPGIKINSQFPVSRFSLNVVVSAIGLQPEFGGQALTIEFEADSNEREALALAGVKTLIDLADTED